MKYRLRCHHGEAVGPTLDIEEGYVKLFNKRDAVGQSYITLATALLISLTGVGALPSMAENAAQEGLDSQWALQGSSGHDTAMSEVMDTHLPGDRRIAGHIKNIRGGQIEVDIGNLQSLSVPLKMAIDKGQTFKPGDEIVITLNDHNAVVDYHHPGEPSHHQVVRGRLITPLTVGLDKAVIKTDEGIKTFLIAERARGKLIAMPVGPELSFMTDETGLLVDAQLASVEAVQESAENNKARIKGAHVQVRAVFQGSPVPSPAAEARETEAGGRNRVTHG
jgi:hypothetical protein